MSLTVKHENDKAYLGEDDHLALSGKVSFTEMVYRTLSEQTPSEEQLNLFDLILNLSIDHGPDAPSAKATIEEAKKGESISEAVAEGIEEINDTHGGAIEPLMKLLYEMLENNLTAEEVVKKFVNSDMKLPGFGHRIYKGEDPRAELIFKQAEEFSLADKSILLTRELRDQLRQQTGKEELPINIDGAIAAILCGLDWQPKLGKAVFIVARTPGLCAHYLNTIQ